MKLPRRKFLHLAAGTAALPFVGRVGRQAGQFTVVHNVTVDRLGNIYTAEIQAGQRIQKFGRLETAN